VSPCGRAPRPAAGAVLIALGGGQDLRRRGRGITTRPRAADPASRGLPVDSAQRDQRLPLRVGAAGQAGDVQALVAAIAPQHA
jgi:hypothetical protein